MKDKQQRPTHKPRLVSAGSENFSEFYGKENCEVMSCIPDSQRGETDHPDLYGHEEMLKQLVGKVPDRPKILKE